LAWLAGILGPLLARELFRLSRGWKLRLAMIAAPTFVFLSLFSAGRIAPREMTLQQRADLSELLVEDTFFFSAVSIALALPLVICPTIIRERRTGAIDLLLVTQVSPPQVLLGMTGASIAVAGCIVASLAPVWAMMSLFGGVTGESIVIAVSALLLEVGCLTSASLFASVLCKSPTRAVAYSILFGLPLFGASWTLLRSLVPFFATADDSDVLGTLVMLGASVAIVAVLGVFMTVGGPVLRSCRDDVQQTTRRTLSASNESNLGIRERNDMWAPLTLRVDDHEPTWLQFRSIWVICLVIGMPLCWLIGAGEPNAVGTMLVFAWAGIQPFVLVVSATNPLLSRRAGFFDDVLATTLPEREIVGGAFRVMRPPLFRLLAAPLGFGVIWLALNPMGIGVGTLLGIGWTLEFVAVGLFVSLVDHRLVARLSALSWFLIFAGLGPAVLAEFVDAPPSLLPFVCAAAIAVSSRVKRTSTVRHAMFSCLMIHWSAVSFAGWLTWASSASPTSQAFDLINPLHWLWAGFSNRGASAKPAQVLLIVVAHFVAALVIWAHCVMRFDELVGRTHPRRADEERPS
jgi:hypothetical protein